MRNLQSPYAFQMQPIQQSVTPRDVIDRGLSAEQELYGGPGPQVPDLPEEMAVIDGTTSDLMQQWGDIQNMAQTLWHNYRINVTKPDMSNPLAVQASMAFQKAMAALQYGGAKLKDYNSMIKGAREKVLQGEGTMLANPNESYMPNMQEWYGSTKLDPRVQQSNQYNARVYESEEARNAANAQVKANIAELQRDLNEAQKRGYKGKVYELQRAIDAIQKGVYQEPWQLTKAAQDGAAQDMDIFNEVFAMRSGLAQGNENDVSRLLMVLQKNGYPEADVKAMTMRDGLRGVRIKTGKDSAPRDIIFDPEDKSTYGGFKNLYDLLQALNPDRYKVPTSRIVGLLSNADMATGLPSGAGIPTARPGVLGENTRGMELARNMEIAYSLQSEEETPGGTGARNIKPEEKVQFVNMLNKLAEFGQLVDNTEKAVSKVYWVNGTLVLVPPTALLESEYEGKDAKSFKEKFGVETLDFDPRSVRTIDLKTRAGQEQIEQMLKNNESGIVSGGTTSAGAQQGKVGEIDKKSGNVTSEQMISIDQMTPDEILEYYKKQKAAKN